MVEMWRQIWHEVRDSAGLRGNRAGTPCLTLADSPAVKELLRGQVQLLLLSVRERAATLGRDRQGALTRYHPGVVKYALGNRPGNRPGDGCGPNNRQCEAEEEPSSRATVSPCQQGRESGLCGCQENEVETVKDKLNLSDIHQVVLHLQLVLREECEGLKRQVVSLQESIEQEYRAQHDPDLPEPSVAELREQRRIIQKDLEHHRLFLTPSSSLKDEDIESRSTTRGVKPSAESPRPSTPTRTAKPHPPPIPPAHPRARPPIRHPLGFRALCSALVKPRSAPPPRQPDDGQPEHSPASRDGQPVQSQSARELRSLHTQRVAPREKDGALRCPNASDGGGGGGVSFPGRLPPLRSSRCDVTDSVGTEERGARSHNGRRPCSGRVKNANRLALATEVTQSPTFHGESFYRTAGTPDGVRAPEGSHTNTQCFSSTFTGHCTRPLCEQSSPTSSPEGLLLQPAPPAVQRPASRGQAVSRRLGRTLGDRVPSLV